jgi:CubicO group peptidase (beta-lactamase class C family)
MSLQLLLEQVTGKGLDDLLKEGLTGPLNMTSTYYNRGNVQLNQSELIETHVVSTEYQIEVLGAIEPDRPQPVWGTVSMNIC